MIRTGLLTTLGAALVFGLGTAQATRPLAMVNGEAVTVEQLSHIAQQQAQTSLDQLQPQQREALLQQLIQLTLLAQEAERDGLAERPDIQALIQNSRRTALAQGALRGIAEGEDLDEDALRERYDEQYGGEGELELSARHILVEEEDTAAMLIEELDGGADFAELAREHSTGPTGERGGDLGWFSAEEMVPVFSEAAQALEIGEYTAEPVQTRFGWHVIRLDDRRSSEPPAFEEVSEQLRNQLIGERIEAHIDELMADAEIEEIEDGGE